MIKRRNLWILIYNKRANQLSSCSVTALILSWASKHVIKYRKVAMQKLYVRKTKRDESEDGRRERERDESGMENRRVWLGSWVLGNSRRPPNELFSSLPIYFCSLFNQPQLAALRPSSFLVSASSSETPKVLFLRCSSGESTLERGPSSRTAWINGRRESTEKVYTL